MAAMILWKDSGSGFNSQRSSQPTPNLFRHDYYFSAPTSPSHLSPFYKDFDHSGGASVPFDWEEKPGTPKSPARSRINERDDFVFDLSHDDWDMASLSADDLFDGGVIKPLKPPSRLQLISNAAAASLRNWNKEEGENDVFVAPKATRGRERGVVLSESSSRRAARSVSPPREHRMWKEEEEEKEQWSDVKNFSSKRQKKWKIMNFFLFRSASEGRAADRDPLKKYTAAAMRRSIESSGSRIGSRRRGPVSAHELHYTMNRAVSEDLKKKTFLPYKQGILGRLAFNPAVHALANGFGFSRK